MFRILALFYTYKEDLGLETKFSLKANISLKQFLNIFLSRVYIEELDTDSTLGFKSIIIDT